MATKLLTIVGHGSSLVLETNGDELDVGIEELGWDDGMAAYITLDREQVQEAAIALAIYLKQTDG